MLHFLSLWHLLEDSDPSLARHKVLFGIFQRWKKVTSTGKANHRTKRSTIREITTKQIKFKQCKAFCFTSNDIEMARICRLGPSICCLNSLRYTMPWSNILKYIATEQWGHHYILSLLSLQPELYSLCCVQTRMFGIMRHCEYTRSAPVTCAPINTHDTTRYYMLLLLPYSLVLRQTWCSILRIQTASKISQHAYIQLLI